MVYFKLQFISELISKFLKFRYSGCV